MIDLIVIAIFIILVILIGLRRKHNGINSVKRYLPVLGITLVVFAFASIYTTLQRHGQDGLIDLAIYKKPLFLVLFGSLIVFSLGQLGLELRRINKEITGKQITKKQAIIEFIRLCVTLVIFFALLDIFIFFFNQNSFRGVEQFSSFAEIFVSFIYYSVVSFTTLGFGDITPVTMLTRFILIIEVLSSFVGIGLIASELVSGTFSEEGGQEKKL